MSTTDSMEYLTSTVESEASNTWIDNFVSLAEHSALTKVPQEFIEDRFNLVGLSRYVPNIEKALKVLQGEIADNVSYKTATLYYLVHQRYIFTKQGLEEIFEKVLHCDYGICRNIDCSSTKLIPLGLTDLPDISCVKLYCHNCRTLFQPVGDLEKLDACAFGRSFPHFLIMTYKSSFPRTKYGKYVPRIFGFRLFEEG